MAIDCTVVVGVQTSQLPPVIGREILTFPKKVLPKILEFTAPTWKILPNHIILEKFLLQNTGNT